MSVILLISPESWNAHTVSKHHYAVTLAARGYTVFFLNPPDDSLSVIKIERVSGAAELYVVAAPKVAVGIRFYPTMVRRWLENRWLRRLEKEARLKIDTVWLFENSRFFDMTFAGNRLKIYHQVDLNQNFQAETAARTADICFTTTDFISQRLQPYNPRVYKIHHGVSITASAKDLPDSLARNFTPAKVQAGFVGNLDMAYLDIPLLSGLVMNFPEITFHFVGGYRKEGKLYQACASAPNVVWWGQIDSALIPAILRRCDILLVTYLAEDFKEQLASPHKMMEYLASGKTIVATYTDEYKDKRHLVEMVDTSSAFPGVFAKVIEDISAYNSKERQDARIEYATQHSYDRQLDKIMTLLKAHGLDARAFQGNI